MSITEETIRELNKEAEENGFERCQICGYKWPKGTEGYHRCIHHMVPRDLFQRALEKNKK